MLEYACKTNPILISERKIFANYRVGKSVWKNLVQIIKNNIEQSNTKLNADDSRN